MLNPNIPIVNSGNLYVQNMQMVWLATTPALALPTVQVQAGASRDSSNVNDIILSAPATIVINQFGANGVDVNAYDPGNSTAKSFYANAFYAIYVIGDSTGYQPTAAFLSLDAVANPPSPPSVVGSLHLPLGYDMYRRVGYVYTDASSPQPKIYGFIQYGSANEKDMWYFNLLKGFLYSAGSSPTTFTANELVQGIPYGPTAYETMLIVDYIPTASANFIQMSSYNAMPTATGMVKFGCGDAGAIQNNVIRVPSSPDPSGYPAVWYESSNAGDSVTVSVIGYKDYL